MNIFEKIKKSANAKKSNKKLVILPIRHGKKLVEASNRDGKTQYLEVGEKTINEINDMCNQIITSNFMSPKQYRFHEIEIVWENINLNV